MLHFLARLSVVDSFTIDWEMVKLSIDQSRVYVLSYSLSLSTVLSHCSMWPSGCRI